MEKRLSCRAMGLNCDFVVRDESEEKIVERISEHLKTAHGVEPDESIRRKAKDLIRLEAA
jgi:predicted small metal-binding protein